MSAGGVAAQEGVEHWQLHALLVPSTPRHHRALAVCCVEVVAVARVRQAEFIRRDGYQQLYQHIYGESGSCDRTYLMMGLNDFGKVISLTGFKSHVLHNLKTKKRTIKPFQSPLNKFIFHQS